MKIIYSVEFLESFTGAQEELDAITQQLETALMNGDFETIADTEHLPYNKPTLH